MHTRADGKTHDVTFACKDGPGITFHCSDEPALTAGPRLDSYCRRRKYKERADKWFGLCMASRGPEVRFGISLTYPWVEDAQLTGETRDMPAPMPIEEAMSAVLSRRRRVQKVGRNDPCPCGSGLKFKKCCSS
ncbi:SEC-C metal-binding domain-containing protein [Cupriavidus basilensis]|uniref:SEC-C metal-binding domain-containing protein n=1 Tax=Cupriavidus basilensis TaxID=68895 RepID=UPI003457DACA